MKIVQVMPFFGYGGAEVMCEALITELVRAGHTVTAVSLGTYHSAITDRLEAAGVEIRYLDKRPGRDPSMIRKLRRILKEVRPDVVHTHLYTTPYVLPAAILAGVKRRVHTVHNVAQKEIGRLGRCLNRFFFKCCHTTPVALSALVQETIVETYRLRPSRVPVVFNGIDLSRCRAKESYRRGDVFRIVHVGSFKEQKNHVGLIEAFAALYERHADCELHLLGDSDGRERIEAMVRERGLSDAVIFHGAQPNVHEYLQSMDLFVLPSLYEGLPITIIEAMGTGLPIVATAVGGVPDMLDDRCATLVPVDTAAVTEAMEAYYLDETLRRTHGTAALSCAARFSAATMAREYLNVYEGGVRHC